MGQTVKYNTGAWVNYDNTTRQVNFPYSNGVTINNSYQQNIISEYGVNYLSAPGVRIT